MLAMQFDDRYQTEDVINRKIKKHHHEALAPAHAIQTMADALPAIGIIAAVLGVIKTMCAIDQPPEVLGGMIGGALVGTFLGVFLAYCFVQPISGRLRQIEDEDAAFYPVIRDIFVAMVADHPPNICIEIGRGNIPTRCSPTSTRSSRRRKSCRRRRNRAMARNRIAALEVIGRLRRRELEEQAGELIEAECAGRAAGKRARYADSARPRRASRHLA